MSRVEDAVDLILEQWRRERPDLDCSPMGIIGRISQLQREVHLAQRATFARHGLDVPSFDVLAALRRAGPPYQLTPTASNWPACCAGSSWPWAACRSDPEPAGGGSTLADP